MRLVSDVAVLWQSVVNNLHGEELAVGLVSRPECTEPAAVNDKPELYKLVSQLSDDISVLIPRLKLQAVGIIQTVTDRHRAAAYSRWTDYGIYRANIALWR